MDQEPQVAQRSMSSVNSYTVGGVCEVREREINGACRESLVLTLTFDNLMIASR